MMRNAYYILIPFCITFSCGTQEESLDEGQLIVENIDSSLSEKLDSTLNVDGDSPEPPKRINDDLDLVLAQVNGDLDKDGVDEKVVVYSRDLEWESSSPRDLVIYKQKEGNWEKWVETENAILHADEGGMMGDPFYGDIIIAKGILEISHSGGSSWKWGYTDKYRYQNGAFYLIGYTHLYGKPCEYWENIDYNLSTGDCVFSYEAEVCEDYESYETYGPNREEKFNHKMKELPKLINRRNFSYGFTSPEGDQINL